MKLKACLLSIILMAFWLLPVLSEATALSEPSKAMLYSAFIPGGGQFYNHAWLKAGLVVGVQGYLISNAIYNDAKMKDYRALANQATDSADTARFKVLEQDHKDRLNNDLWWIGITTGLSMIDAFVDAHLKDFDAQKQNIKLRFSSNSLAVQVKF